jgi:hypothetical protein
MIMKPAAAFATVALAVALAADPVAQMRPGAKSARGSNVRA